MPGVNEKIVSSVWGTLSAICESPRIAGFKVGITHDPRKRFRTFRRFGYECFAILAHGLLLEDVLELERAIFDRVQKDKRSTVYKKDARKDVSYRPSSGGKKVRGPEYSFYVAWW